MKFFLSISFILISIFVSAQTTKTDSIFEGFNLKYSPEALKNAKLEYEQANDTIKAIMYKVYSLPMSSRAELVDNYEQRSNEINNLKEEFEKVVPKGYVVALDIKLSDGPLRNIESIDIQIFKKDKKGHLDLIDGDWGIEYGSERLDYLLDIIGWDAMTFSGIKNMFQMANCISIQNGDQTEIGFARSGLGKYSYLIFRDKLLTVPQIKEYNDECQYMYYKKNIVLMYEGGMAGPQCFTD